MNAWIKRVGIVVLVVVMAFGVIGTAAAQGPGGRPDRPGLMDRERLAGAVLRALSDASGLTWDDVLPQLREGQTLAEIIAANGLDVDAVTAQAKATLTEQINRALADGKIGEEAANRLLDGLDDALDRVLNTVHSGELVRERIGDMVEQSMFVVMAEMAGMEPGDLLRDVLTPPTLAEVAADLGLDPDAIIDETVARVTANVTEAVEAGRLTEDQAAQLLDGLRERLEDRMDRPFRLPRERGRQGGHGPMGPGRGPNAPASTDAPSSTGV